MNQKGLAKIFFIGIIILVLGFALLRSGVFRKPEQGKDNGQTQSSSSLFPMSSSSSPASPASAARSSVAASSAEPVTLRNVWEKEITGIDASPSPENCLGKSVSQKFSARLSKQFPGTSYKGTFLHLSGSPTVEYITDIANPRYASRKLLEYELWKSGFRILELKFSSKTGWEPNDRPDEQWRGTGMVCETEPLVKSLKFLEGNGMWPAAQKDRFAMGTSNGALMMAYAVDFHKSPHAKVNRVLLQSPIAYDLYAQCQEMPVSPFMDFYFSDKCRNYESNKIFLQSQQIKSKLNSDNCAMTLGKDSYLIVFGKSGEVPAWYKDESQRYVPDRKKTCPLKTAYWDAPAKYEGHSPIIDYYRINRNVDAFVNYFSKGELNFID